MTTSDVTDLLHAFYASLASGDASAWADQMGEDALCIGTDEPEWWHGREAMMPILRAQVSEMSAAGISMAAGDPIVGEHGDVVWVADRPTMTQPDGSTITLRATLVAVRVDAGLRVEQMHLSVPAPNEEVVQRTLTV